MTSNTIFFKCDFGSFILVWFCRKKCPSKKFWNFGLRKIGLVLSLDGTKCFGGIGINYLADPNGETWSPRIFCDVWLLRFSFFTSSPLKQWKWNLLLPRICFVFSKSATSFIELNFVSEFLSTTEILVSWLGSHRKSLYRITFRFFLYRIKINPRDMAEIAPALFTLL